MDSHARLCRNIGNVIIRSRDGDRRKTTHMAEICRAIFAGQYGTQFAVVGLLRNGVRSSWADCFDGRSDVNTDEYPGLSVFVLEL